MGFAGNLRTLSLAEVVQTLNRIKAEGVLRIASQLGTRDVVFAQGEIVGVADREGGEHRLILRRLALTGTVRMPDANELLQAEATIASLVELGTVTNDQFLDLVQEQALETLYDLSNWTNADFLFHESTESDEFEQMVARHRANDLNINVNSVLMESARRHDEWEMIKDLFMLHDVPQIISGREEETGKHRTGFPGNLLVPLVDGTRSIEEILEETGLTLFSVFSTLSTMQEEGSLRLMTPDELHDVAESLALSDRQGEAARVFRHILSARPEDSAAVTALASCLADLGDTSEAAECHAQLALSHLAKERVEDALEDANRAVELCDKDPRHRGILVRCLIQRGDLEAAAEHLAVQAKQYEDAGLIEEARDTWRKVLDVRPGDDSTRHNLAAIQVKQSTGSGDVAVCLECGTVNTRERDDCSSCGSKLRLGCMVCGKTVSIADRICIFCGANPHLSADQQGPRRNGPSTERVERDVKVPTEKKDKGSQYWRGELRKILDTAREFEEAGKLEEALEQWRELLRLQQGNTDLIKHIRDLEGVMHDRFVEREIARGHELRRSRKYWRALRSYRASLRGMGEDDLRGARLREIIDATQRSHRRILTIYSLAVVVIIATGILAVKPYYDVATIERVGAEIEHANVEMANVDDIRIAQEKMAKLRVLAEALHGGHHSRAERALTAAEGTLIQSRLVVLEHAFKEAEARIDAKDAAGARSRIEGLSDLFDVHYQARAAALEKEVQGLLADATSLQASRAAAPQRMKAAVASEEDGRLGEALSEYRAIAALEAKGVSDEATAALARLEPRYQAFADRIRGIGAQAKEDLEKAASALAACAKDAKSWGMEEKHQALVEDLKKRRQAATAAWNALGEQPKAPALEAFIAEHAASPEGALARARLAQNNAIVRQREAALESYRKAVKERDFVVAFQLATTLHQQFTTEIAEGAAPYPLSIQTIPAGVTVTREGKVLGKTPCVIAYEPAQAKIPLQLVADGFDAFELVPSSVGDWTWSGSLIRSILWKATSRKPGRQIVTGADGIAVVVSDVGLEGLAVANGKRAWNAAFGEADPMVPERTAMMPPIRMADGTVIAAGVGTPVLVVGADGKIRSRHPVAGSLRALPTVFRNDLLGGDQRLALVSDVLQTGPIAGPLSTVALKSACLSGTVVLRGDLDQVLVIADLQGRLIAVEESSGKVVWSEDLGAAEVGRFLSLGKGRMLMILDGSRLACWQTSVGSAKEQWSRSLDTQPMGGPVVSGETIHVSAGSAILRNTVDGAELPSIDLPSPVTTAIQFADAHTAAVGCARHLVIFVDGAISWTTPVPSPISAVGCMNGSVIAALDDGTILAYQL